VGVTNFLFLKTVQTGSGDHSASYLGSFLAVNWSGREIYQSPVPSAELKNERCYTSLRHNMPCCPSVIGLSWVSVLSSTSHFQHSRCVNQAYVKLCVWLLIFRFIVWKRKVNSLKYMRACLSEVPVFVLCHVHLPSSYKFHESQLIILMLIPLIVWVESQIAGLTLEHSS
jgi:hypothetical protein